MESVKQTKYESPQMEKVTLILEQAIAGSVPVTPHPDTGGFQEVWNEEIILTGDVEIL